MQDAISPTKGLITKAQPMISNFLHFPAPNPGDPMPKREQIQGLQRSLPDTSRGCPQGPFNLPMAQSHQGTTCFAFGNAPCRAIPALIPTSNFLPSNWCLSKPQSRAEPGARHRALPKESKFGGVSLATDSLEIGQVPRHVFQQKDMGHLLTGGAQNFSGLALNILIWKGEVVMWSFQCVGTGLQPLSESWASHGAVHMALSTHSS